MREKLRGSLIKKVSAWKNSLMGRVSFVVSVSLLITFSLLGNIYYYFSANTVREEMLNGARNATESAAEFWAGYLEQIEEWSLTPILDSQFVSAANLQKNLPAHDYIESTLRVLFHSRDDVYSLTYYNSVEGTLYSIDRKGKSIQFRIAPEMRESYAYTVSETALGHCCYETFSPAPLIKNSTENLRQPMLRFSRVYINIPGNDAFGMLTITLNPAYWVNRVLPALAPDDEPVALFLPDGDLVCTNNPLIIENAFVPSEQNSIQTVEIDQERYYSVLARNNDADALVLKVIPESQFTGRLRVLRNTLWCLAGLLASVAIVFNLVMARRLTSPLQKLSDHMREMKPDKLVPFKFDEPMTAEVDQLKSGFNDILSRLDDLINREYKAQLSEKVATLSALENQISPHFLCNTLQSISTTIMAKKPEEACQMLVALGRLIEYSFHGESMVTVGEEIKNLSFYVKLIQGRFGERFQFSMDVDDATVEYMIPKLAVQGLVENTVKHILEGGYQRVCVALSAYIERETLCIIVRDDGPGISSQDLRRIETAQPAFGGNLHVGLANLRERLLLIYGDKARLNIETGKNGTTILIRINRVVKNETDHH